METGGAAGGAHGTITLDIPVDMMSDVDVWQTNCGGQSAPPDRKAATVQKIWLRDIIRILSSRTAGLHIDQLEHMLWQLQYPATPMPDRFRVQLQSLLSRYTSQSVVFRQRSGRPADDLFFSPEGKGSGTWAVHRAAASAWLLRQRVTSSCNGNRAA